MLHIDVYAEADKKKMLLFANGGAKLRERILNKINEQKEMDLVKLDFRQIEVTDVSFAREGFVKLVVHLGIESRRPQLLFVNVDEYVKQNLDLSFKEHKKLALITDKTKKWELIGKYTQQVQETVKTLIETGQTTARELAKHLQIELTTCNNRLTNLYEMCAVMRKEVGQKSGGIEYMYKISL